MKTPILIITLVMLLLNCGKKNKVEPKIKVVNRSEPKGITINDKTPEWFLLKTKNRCYEDLNKAYLMSLFGRSEGC
ncbi:MAG: hypothetical protein IPG89_03310 [Bacteroidetes bacterium]|nr:hypothetical protein [Bacteroidota bacterium]